MFNKAAKEYKKCHFFNSVLSSQPGNDWLKSERGQEELWADSVMMWGAINGLIPPCTAALALDTYHLELLANPDTYDSSPGQEILRIYLIHHSALLQ